MSPKHAILVSVDDEKVFSNLLFGLISQDGQYDAALWNQKHFRANEPKLSIRQKLIFLGEFEESKNMIPNIKWEYEQFGMKYGWLGNKAVVYVDKEPMTKEEYVSFIELIKGRVEDLKKYENENDLVKDQASIVAISTGIGVLAAGPILWPAGIPLLGAAWIRRFLKRKRKIYEQRFTYLVTEFHKNGLSKFMGEK